MDVRTLLRRSAEFHAAREAVTFRDRRFSFAEAWQRGLQMANGLGALGLKPGDRVAFLGIGSGLNCMMLGWEW